MRIYEDISLRNFKFWSGAVDTAKVLTDEQLDRVETELEMAYPDSVSDTFINDLFWFEPKTVYEWAGYDPVGDMELDEGSVSKSTINDIAEYIDESYENALAFAALAIMTGDKARDIKEDFTVEDEDLHKYSYNHTDYLVGTKNEINQTLKSTVYSEEYEEIWREGYDSGDIELSLDEWRKSIIRADDYEEAWECVFGVTKWGNYQIDCKTIYVLEVTEL